MLCKICGEELHFDNQYSKDKRYCTSTLLQLVLM